ncbi:MAG TPA: hypothetical protein VK151_08860 [Fluviicola sp.]|nr:hypothetical protein [Fluviicola sp.]
MIAKYSIRWTENASDTYIDTLENILDQWTVKEAESFENATDELLKQLSSNSKICPEIKKFKLRRCVLSYQTSLVYRIVSKTIELIAFVDNRSDHIYQID